MLLVPEAWQNDPLMSQEKKDLYMFNSTMVSVQGWPNLCLWPYDMVTRAHGRSK